MGHTPYEAALFVEPRGEMGSVVGEPGRGVLGMAQPSQSLQRASPDTAFSRLPLPGAPQVYCSSWGEAGR